MGPTVLSALGVDEPRGMNGADLSPLFDGQAPRTKRTYRTAAYNTYLSASRRPLAPDRRQPQARSCASTTRKRTAASATTSPHRHPKKVRELWGTILHDAGGQLPRFPKTGGEG